MKILLVSDSHGRTDRLEKLFEKAKKARIKNVFHAGDLAVYGVEKIFEKFPELNFFIARGNCDVNEEVVQKIQQLPHCTLEEVVEVEIQNIKFAISHIEGIAQMKTKKTADVYCHGHTHRPKIENREGFKVLNPGALCEDGGFFLISIPDLEVRRFLIR